MSNVIYMIGILMHVLLKIVNFLRCDIGADHQVSGQWVTSNKSILSVNVASGQAKAIRQGSAHGNIDLSFHAYLVHQLDFKRTLRNIFSILLLIHCRICTVTFEGHGLKLQTKVTVLLGNTIYVDSPRETLTNVHVPAEGYNFPVKLRSVILMLH